MSGGEKIKQFIPNEARREGTGLDIPEQLLPVTNYLQKSIGETLAVLEDAPRYYERLQALEGKDLSEMESDLMRIREESRTHMQAMRLLLRQLADQNYKPVISHLENELDNMTSIESEFHIPNPSPQFLKEREEGKKEIRDLIALLRSQMPAE